MDLIFKDAYNRRRNKEFVLTSRLTNVQYYGSAAWAVRRDIWPPLSKIPSFDDKSESSVPPTAVAQSERYQHFPNEHVTEHIRLQLRELKTESDSLYQPLHDGQIIRILELLPGEENEPLQCTFHYASLEQLHQPYEALSYVWGEKATRLYDDQSQAFKYIYYYVQCNDYKCRVTPNLADALWHVRLPVKSRFLWVDALCINQDDIRERGHQVTLMSSIYRKASKVLIWVTKRDEKGFWDYASQRKLPHPPAFEDSRAQRAFGAICDIVNTWRGDNVAHWRATYSVNVPQSSDRQYFNTFDEYPVSAQVFAPQNFLRECLERHYRSIKSSRSPKSFPGQFHKKKEKGSPMPPDAGINSTVESASGSQFWLSIADLFNLPWFWRVWVLQEAVLAREAIVLWANTSIDWRWIGLAAAILRTNYHAICENMRIVGVYNAYVMYRMSSMSDLPPPEMSLIQLLRLTRQFEVTDPRDRVYGLLGIKTVDNDPTNQNLFLEPDYTITQAQLWKRVAWISIQRSQNLNIFSSVQYTAYQFESETSEIAGGSTRRYDIQKDSGRLDDFIPSWVPHWDSAYRVTLSPWDIADAFSAAKGFPLQLLNAAEADPDTLVLQGIRVGLVAYEGHFMWHDVDYSMLLSSDLGSFFASEPGLRLLARTFTAGRNSYGSLIESNDELVADFAAYILDLHQRYVADALERVLEARRHRSPGLAALDVALGIPEFEYDPRKDETWKDISPSNVVRQNSGPPSMKNFQRLFNLHPDLETTLQRLAEDGDASRFRETAISLCERRRLFLTLNGFLGIGPDTVREGDVVAVLSGGDMPFVLRPVKPPTSPSTNDNIEAQYQDTTTEKYLLVGETFVEGIMLGEAVDSTNQQRSAFSGPVPTAPIIERILAHGNEPEDIPYMATICELERLKIKKVRLDAGRLFDPDMLSQHVQFRCEKKVLEIVGRGEPEEYRLGDKVVTEEVYRCMYDVASLGPEPSSGS